MWPIALRFGTFEIGSYGVLIVLAMYAALALAAYLGKRDDLAPKEVNTLGILTIVGGVVGAKLLDILVVSMQAGQFVFRDIRAAGAIHGGVIGAAVTMIVLVRHYKMPFRWVFDAHTPATALGQAIGRVGCFLAGCCYGSEAGPGNIAVVFSSAKAQALSGTPLHVALHPVQLYDGLAHLLLAIGLTLLHKRGYFRGRLVFVYLIAEGVTRFTIETFRGDPGRGVWALGLSTGRLTAVAFALVGILGLALFAPRRPTGTGGTQGNAQAKRAS